MWKLVNDALGADPLINNRTVIGLELCELSTLDINSPLFTYNPLSSSNLSTKTNVPSSGQQPVVDNNVQIVPVESFLYTIDGNWDFESLDYVVTINQLDVGKYTKYDNKTYLITNETVLVSTSVLTSDVGTNDSTYTFEMDLSEEVIAVESIDYVIVEGLRFATEGSDFSFDPTTKLLTITGSANCRPPNNAIAEIYTSKTIDLSTITKNKVFIFDYSTVNVSVITYLNYLGTAYTISSSLLPGTLFNNYLTKKAICIS